MSLFNQRPGRIALFTLLYLSEGAPIGFIWWALPTILRAAGVDVPKITALTAMLVLPWVFKFLWAPLVDAMRTPRWGFRAWIISAQLAMGLTLLPLIWVDPIAHFQWWGVLLLWHALFAATLDVAIDAMAINLVPEHQRGNLNGCMQTGMLVGRSLFGGGALLVAAAGGITAAGFVRSVASSLLLDQHGCCLFLLLNCEVFLGPFPQRNLIPNPFMQVVEAYFGEQLNTANGNGQLDPARHQKGYDDRVQRSGCAPRNGFQQTAIALLVSRGAN